MKFLVLALCVYAVAAETEPIVRGLYNAGQWQPARAVAQAALPVAQAVFTPAAQTFVQQPALVAKTVYSGQNVDAPILRNEYENTLNGYNWAYETGNGINAAASAVLKKVGEGEALVSQGSYAYVNADGSPVQLTYVADENGYQPKSDVLPVAPAIPEAILRSLEYIRTHPAFDADKKQQVRPF